MDDLAVLRADVDDGDRLREMEVGPAAVAGDLGQVAAGPRDVVAAVAGGKDAATSSLDKPTSVSASARQVSAVCA